MIENSSRLVRPDDIRPARPDGTCFYCCQPLAHEHKPECVIRKRSVVVQVTIAYVIAVPESWTLGDIERHRGESSWCANNMLGELQHIADREGSCLCRQSQFKFLREAKPYDHQALGIPKGWES